MKSLSRVGLFATPRTVAYQAPPSMEFSRQDYWSGLPCPSSIVWEVNASCPRSWRLSNRIMLLLSCLSHVRLCATPETAAYPSLGFSRQEHCGGLPCPSPRRERENGKGSRSVVSDSVRQRGLRPTGLLPGSSVHGIFRARGLEWGAVAFSEYETTIIPILFFRITVLFVT